MIDFEDDLQVMLSDRDFGTPVEYKGQTFNVIFDYEHKTMGGQYQSDIDIIGSLKDPVITCSKANFADIQQGDQVIIAGRAFVVRDVPTDITDHCIKIQLKNV